MFEVPLVPARSCCATSPLPSLLSIPRRQPKPDNAFETKIHGQRKGSNPLLLCSQPCGIRASFGGCGLVANVGPLLPSTLADRLSQGELVTVTLTRELPPVVDPVCATSRLPWWPWPYPAPTVAMAPIHCLLTGMPAGVIFWMLRWSSTAAGGPTTEGVCRPSCVHDVRRSQERNGL